MINLQPVDTVTETQYPVMHLVAISGAGWSRETSSGRRYNHRAHVTELCEAWTEADIPIFVCVACCAYLHNVPKFKFYFKLEVIFCRSIESLCSPN